MLQDILIPLLAIGLAELGDKTQLAVFCLASQTKKHVRLLLGVILAFAIADGLAIVFGNILTNVIPATYIKIGAGLIFIIFGILILLNKKKPEEKYDLKRPFMSAFLLVFISEMGDKTQIASGLFAMKFNPILVFIGVMIALIALSVIAVYFGKLVTKKVNKQTISTIAGILFILIGIITLIM